MNKPSPKLTLEEKIDYLTSKVEQIDKTVNPPFWKKLINWVVNNFWTLVFLMIIGYFVWQIWEVVQAVQQGVEVVNIKISDAKTSFSDAIEPIKQQLSELDLERLKFWRD